MKTQRHTEEQIAFVLQQVELGAPVAEVVPIIQNRVRVYVDERMK